MSDAEETTGATPAPEVVYDLNGDGVPDKITKIGDTTYIDWNDDDKFDAVVQPDGKVFVDLDGDGTFETQAIDASGDGRIDTLEIDLDGDGVPDVIERDLNGDGKFDEVERHGIAAVRDAAEVETAKAEEPTAEAVEGDKADAEKPADAGE